MQHAVDVALHLGRALVALLGVVLQRAGDDALGRLGDLGVENAHRRILPQRLDLGGVAPGEQVVQRGAQGVEVGERGLLARELLIGRVAGRAERGGNLLAHGPGRAGLELVRGNAEVDHAHAVIGIDEDVAGLDVAVDHLRVL